MYLYNIRIQAVSEAQINEGEYWKTMKGNVSRLTNVRSILHCFFLFFLFFLVIEH